MIRSSIAVLLLLVLVGVASDAGPLLCATGCAGNDHRHAELGVTVSGHHHHHHSAKVAVSTTAVSSAKSRHCARSGQPALVQRTLPQTPTFAVVAILAVRALPLVNSEQRTPVVIATTPPGPPVLPSQLRI